LRTVNIGNLKLGSDIIVQSMCNTQTTDIEATVNQILALVKAGCQMVRVAVPDMESVASLTAIKARISIPLIADVHFDYKLAVESCKFCDKVRINPGNLGGLDKFKSVIEAAQKNKKAIRIGVNLGSLSKSAEEKYGRTAKAMVESALEYTDVCDEMNFSDVVVSLKASDVRTTIEANRLFAQKSDIPLHLGVTEAGTVFSGTIKSSIGIGSLLADGIGATIRVSLTADPVQEIPVAISILKSLGLRKGVEIISCPTCARTQGDVISMANEVEKRLGHLDKPIKVAVMGCEVNGPGEAKDADVGVALTNNQAVIFKKGSIVDTVEIDSAVNRLLDEIWRA